MEIAETFYPKNRGEWRVWLSKNHHKKKEIWLVFYKKHTRKPTLIYQDAVDEALCFGWIDGMEKRIDEEKYALRFTPRSKRSGWSTGNVTRYKMLIKAGLMTKAGTQAFENKHTVYTSHMKSGGSAWHKNNKMPDNPTTKERIVWHREHQKYCGCRPTPKSLTAYFTHEPDPI